MADGRNFGTMISRMSREIRRSGLTADIKDAIVDSIRFYENERFGFNETSSVVRTTASNAYLSSLPTGLLELDAVEMDQSDTRFVVNPKPWEWVVNADNGNSTGAPSYYTLYKNNVRFYPIPDAAYSVHLSYQVQLLEVSASATATATNAWMQDAEPMVRARAKGLVFLHRLRDYKSAKAMDVVAEQEHAKLTRKTVGKMAHGIITKTSF